MGMHATVPGQAPSWDFPTRERFCFAIAVARLHEPGSKTSHLGTVRPLSWPGTRQNSPHPFLEPPPKKTQSQKSCFFGYGRATSEEAAGRPGLRACSTGGPVAKRPRQGVLDLEPAINPCILAKTRLFLEVYVNNGSREL